MPKVSIIVPVYNVYEYIDRCIESLVTQTFKDIEIILINDGSTDKTIEKLEYWKDKDSRIIVINNENNGAAFSRNYGINISRGEYISFIDADDYCEITMIEKMYTAIKKFNADYVFCDYYVIYEDGKKSEAKIDIDLNQPTTLKDKKELLFKLDPNVWNKLYKKSLLIDNNIFFNDQVLKCHDLPFTTVVLTKATKIIQVKECLYYYLINRQNSITTNFNKKSFEWEDAWPFTVKYFKDNGIFEYYYQELEKRIIDSCLYLIKRAIYESESINLINIAINGHLSYLDSNFHNWEKNIYFNNKNEEILRKALLVKYLVSKQILQKPLIVFSASTGGYRILKLLDKFDVKPNIICDNSNEKINTCMNGIKVVSINQVIEMFGRDIYIVVASETYYDEIKSQLLGLGILKENIF